eukprot:1166466-Rhodomonas_salina.1
MSGPKEEGRSCKCSKCWQSRRQAGIPEAVCDVDESSRVRLSCDEHDKRRHGKEERHRQRHYCARHQERSVGHCVIPIQAMEKHQRPMHWLETAQPSHVGRLCHRNPSTMKSLNDSGRSTAGTHRLKQRNRCRAA